MFALGAWGDGQPMVIGLLAAAGLGCCGMAAMGRHQRLVQRALTSPLCLCALLLAGIGMLTAVLAEHPMRSLLGASETGQGALWYLALAAFSAQAAILRHSRRFWALVKIIAAAGTVCAALFALQGIEWLYPYLGHWLQETGVRFLGFNEYLAYHALALLILAGTERDRRQSWILAGIALAALLISRSRTAFVFFPLILAFAWVLRRRWPSGRLGILSATAMLLLVGGGPLALELWGEVGALWSRGLIDRVALPSLTLWPGLGWGSFPETMIRNLPAVGVQVYGPQWGGIERDLFHSHNALLEGWLAGGLPVGLLALLLPAAVMLRPRAGTAWLALALALGWGVLDGFWFQIPANLPLLAMAAASVSGGGFRLRRRIPRAVMLAAGGLLLVISVLLWRQAFEETQLASCLAAEDCADPKLPFDLAQDRRGLSSILAAAVRQDADLAGNLSPGRAESLSKLIALAELLPPSSPSLSMALLNASAAKAFASEASPLAKEDQAILADIWERDIRRVLAQAPRRLDILSSYFDWLLVHGRSERLQAMVALAAGIDPEHPVTLWFTGVIRLRSDNPVLQAQGFELMRRAYDGGLERYMPVNDVLKQRLGR